MTDLSHADLVRRAARWLSNSAGCSVVFTEYFTSAAESPDAIGFKARWSVLVECKVTRADFLRDRHKPSRRIPQMAMGSQRYFMVPSGLVSPEEVPIKWGLLYACGRHVKVVRQSEGFPDRGYSHEIGFLVSMLRRVELRIGAGISLDGWLKWESRRGQPELAALRAAGE